MIDNLVEQLNDPDRARRLDALEELARMHKKGILEPPPAGENVNNHIHTTYSFSPYTPAKAVYLAWKSGLATAGIMDHDSVGGAEEFIEAGRIIGLPVTVGFECRCDFGGSPFEGKKLNNPDQVSVAYMAMHAIPRHMLEEAERFLAPCRKKRDVRNRRMIEDLDLKLRPYGISLDYDKDVLPLSQHDSGGSVTERHLLYALAAAFTGNELQRYFLLGVFKSQLMESFYIDASDELPHITEFVELAGRLGAIPAYAYLGDVGVSVTGDKRPQVFEDAFLEELLVYLAASGVRAVTYMPARNTAEQLARIKTLCDINGLFQISGEDINSPFQGFICEKIEEPGFRHLIDSAWALIGHESAVMGPPPSAFHAEGMFSPGTISRIPVLADRVNHFADLARASYKN